ncbi:MAG TPA: SIS domain-containing protein [bacterium]|nr:SIS domain-containing protein [bacterium]
MQTPRKVDSGFAAAAANPRTQHPYHMYDAIRQQPDAFAAVAARTAPAADAFVPRLARCDRLYLVGIGTSYHAALAGEHLVRTYGGDLPVQAVHAFDFALYGPRLSPRDAVVTITHRGTKRYTRDALARAREAGCTTVLITGEPQTDGGDRADAGLVLHTVAQERSSAHTVSYAGAVAALGVLAAGVGRARLGRAALDPAVLETGLPAALRGALDLEPDIAARGRALASSRRIWLIGGGPGAVAAAEGALKIKETSYLTAEGMSAEAILHGPFQSSEPDDLFVLIAPAGPAQRRVADVAGAIQEIGAPWIVVDDGTATMPDGPTARWSVPPVPEPFTALTCVVPVQLFAYHLAVARGTNPDSFRLEDPRFARAYRRVTL